ncbi:MAG: hypothetical protein IPP77_06375 [Bacteroidetes bacterium]|nr:hypothetical protein [Bacteroidota bacterium]
MKTVKKRSLKMRRERNKCRVNRLRKQGAMFGLMSSPIFILVSITYAFRKLTSPEKTLARVRFHLLKLAGNVNFPTVNPTLADLQLKADQLQALIDAAKGGDHLLILQRDVVEAEVIEMIRLLGYDIQKQSNGNREMIESAGFETRKPGTPTVAPDQALVKKITALHGAKVKLTWTKLTGAKVMLLEVNTNPGSGIWYQCGISDNIFIVIEGFRAGAEYVFLESQEKYYFRLRGWNHVDFGDFSETVDAVCIE